MSLVPGGGRGVVQRDIIRIEGMRELRRALRDLQDVEATREFREGLKDAARIVATDAQHRARQFSNTIADSIRPRAGGNRAFVVGGKATIPWYGWADFGSRTPNPSPPAGHGPWFKSGPGPERGRFIYPAFDANEEQVKERIWEAIEAAIRHFNMTTS